MWSQDLVLRLNFRVLLLLSQNFFGYNLSYLELHITCSAPPTIFCDNMSGVLLVANPILHNRIKHFELDLHFVRDKEVNKQVYVTHIPSQDQIADVFTKSISSTSFQKFRDKLRVASFSPPLTLRGDDKDQKLEQLVIAKS